ncbi:hypothetical protein CLOM_g7941, partial [Closterium sp. NIES-68]
LAAAVPTARRGLKRGAQSLAASRSTPGRTNGTASAPDVATTEAGSVAPEQNKTTLNTATVVAEPNPNQVPPGPTSTFDAAAEQTNFDDLFTRSLQSPVHASYPGGAGATVFGRVMTNTVGSDPSDDAVVFHEASRGAPIDDELRMRCAVQEEEGKELKKACATKDGHIARALDIASTLADHVLMDRFARIDFVRVMSDSIGDLLFDGNLLNLSPRRSVFVERLVANAGFTLGTEDAVKLIALMKDRDIITATERRFNNRIGKIYSGCRQALRKAPMRLLVAKRGPEGTLKWREPFDFIIRCSNYVNANSTKFKGIEWHVTLGEPLSSVAFVGCAKFFIEHYDPSRPMGLYPMQLLLILAVVRFRLRHPGAGKLQLERSGDSQAMARQARVLQRWINSHGVRTGNYIGIGRVCLVGWNDIPQEELDVDVLGDEDELDEDVDEVVTDDEDDEQDA